MYDGINSSWTKPELLLDVRGSRDGQSIYDSAWTFSDPQVDRKSTRRKSCDLTIDLAAIQLTCNLNPSQK